MFLGTFIHQIDDKCRMRVPTKFKTELGNTPFIMQGSDKCLYVYTRADAEAMFKREFAESSFSDGAKNREKARLMSKACFAEEDNQGRITLPLSLMQYAGITKSSTIVSIGAYDHVQIWNKELWEKFNEAENAESGEAEDRQ